MKDNVGGDRQNDDEEKSGNDSPDAPTDRLRLGGLRDWSCHHARSPEGQLALKKVVGIVGEICGKVKTNRP